MLSSLSFFLRFQFAEERPAWLRNLSKNLRSGNFSMAQTPPLLRPSASKGSTGECVENMAQPLEREVILLVKPIIHTVIQITLYLVVISKCSWREYWWVPTLVATVPWLDLHLRIRLTHMCCMIRAAITQLTQHCLLSLKMGSLIPSSWSHTCDVDFYCYTVTYHTVKYCNAPLLRYVFCNIWSYFHMFLGTLT